jgi:hypothetical protein
MAAKKTGAKKRASKQQKLLADVIKEKGSARAVADEMKAAGHKSSQQSVDAWVKGLWPPRPATQDALRKLYQIPAPWGRA